MGKNKGDLSERNYYMIRAMKGTQEHYDVFFKRGRVAVGWSGVNFSEIDNPNDLAEKVKVNYYSDREEYAPSRVGIWLNEVRRFKGIKEGDIIIVPVPKGITIAEACNKEIYDFQAGQDYDLANQREVKYKTGKDGDPIVISRSVLTEGLQTRLRTRGFTILNLGQFSKEIEGVIESAEGFWSSNLKDQIGGQKEEFRSQLLQRIREGETNLRSGGSGLETLVEELLKIDGYTPKIIGKKEFPPGVDADIRADRFDRFGSSIILVQVKHHIGITDGEAAKQLLGVRDNDADLADARLVVVTSGEAGEELSEICEKENISIVDGDELVVWIDEYIDKLSNKTKQKLGIIEEPRLVPLNRG